MKLVLISPEHDHPREHAVLAELFAAGLDRFHVRKPQASRGEVDAYVRRIPSRYWPRVVLHQHHELVDVLGLGGKHWRDERGTGVPPGLPNSHGRDARATLTSRSCHDLAAVRSSLGHYDSLFFGPVFPSISKPGYGPAKSGVGEALRAVLSTRTPSERRTAVFALGGIDVATAPRALTLGFDGVSVVGAVWQASDPVAAFRALLAIEDAGPTIDRISAGRATVLRSPLRSTGGGKTGALHSA